MSNITNEPKHKLALLQTIRGQLEQRATWLALLTDEAEKKGLDRAAFGDEAIGRCGSLQGRSLANGSKSFKDLKKRLFSKGAQLIFEMEILECDDDKLSIDFHYCPLVKGWQKMGLDDKTIERLCDVAMCGDHNIARQFDGELELGQTIAKGDPICQLRFLKK